MNKKSRCLLCGLRVRSSWFWLIVGAAAERNLFGRSDVREGLEFEFVSVWAANEIKPGTN